MSSGGRESRRKERWRKAKTDISWVVKQMLRQERSGHHSFGREQSLCHAVTYNIRI